MFNVPSTIWLYHTVAFGGFLESFQGPAGILFSKRPYFFHVLPDLLSSHPATL